MKNLILFALLIGHICTGSLAAQSYTSILRAGEHIDFTRIVLTNEAGHAWSISEKTMEFDLVFKDQAVDVDLSQAFDRIPRTRIREILPISGGLRVSLACPCPIRIVEGIDTQIVVDVLSPPKASPNTIPSNRRPQARPELRDQDEILWRAGVALAEQIKIDPTGEIDSSSPHNLEPWFSITPEEGKTQTEESRQDQTSMTDLLVSTISHAVAQNTLVAASNFMEEELNNSTNHDMPSSSHIKLPDDFRQRSASNRSQNCSRAVSVVIPDWTQSTTQEQSSALMSSLFNPLDQLQVDAGKELISYFLISGMGAEARSMISYMTGEEWFDAVFNLSFLIDDESTSKRNILSPLHKCSDEDSLWAFLENPKADWVDHETLPNILRAVKSLNKTLLLHIGPRVLKHLIRGGYEKEVQILQNALDLTSIDDVAMQKDDMNFLFQRAESHKIDSDFDSLEDISDSDLLFILELANEEERPLPIEILKLAQDRSLIHRRGDLAAELSEKTAISLALSEEFSEAFLLAEMGDALAEGLDSKLLEILLSNASDTDFLTSIYEQKPWAQDDLSADLKQRIGQRLEELGFNKDASRVLKSIRTQNVDQSGALIPQEGAAITATDTSADGGVHGAEREAVKAVNSPGVGSERDAVSTAVSDATIPVPRPSQAAQNRSSAAPARMPDLQGPTASPRLLSQSRAALSSSEALRDEMQALFGAGPEGGND